MKYKRFYIFGGTSVRPNSREKKHTDMYLKYLLNKNPIN